MEYDLNFDVEQEISASQDNPEDTETAETETEEVSEDTTPDTETDEEVSESETDGNSDSEAAEENPSDEQPADEPRKIRVKYNHESREFSEEEAVPFIQKGLMWDGFRESHEKLKFLAVANDLSVSNLIDKLIEGNDDAVYQGYLEEAGGNEDIAKRLMNAHKLERQKKFDDIIQTESKTEQETESSKQQALTERLANEFIELRSEYPDKFKDFPDVPEKVIKEAIDKNISLFDAYLRFERAENKKVTSVKKKQENTAKQTTGSMSSEAGNPNEEAQEFSKAFNNVF